MEIEFFGAAGEVTGSCHIIRVGKRQVLLDCGMIQGGRRNEKRNHNPFPFEPAEIDAVVLSHAHIDHSGRLPLLVKRGFSGPIYTQNASRDLARILLSDSAFLQEMEAERRNRKRQRQGKAPIEPLYRQSDAQECVHLLKGQRYAQWFDVTEGIRARFLDAGHIMGSTVVEVESTLAPERRLVFSGDLGQYDTPILRDPVSPESADLVLMETTYGGRHHRDRSETIKEIGEVIAQARADHGNILIPAFAVGRSQEILYQLGMHYDEWGVDRWNVFLDSPLAIEASDIYWNYPHLYDEEAAELVKMRTMPPLPNLQLSRSREDSQAINRMDSGAIIIAGSGMCTGGRIMHHLKHNLWRPQCHVVFVGFQAPGSTGRLIVDRREYVKIHGQTIRVAAQIHTVGGLSAHADQGDLLRWYGGIENRPPVYLVHGEVESGEQFSRALSDRHGAHATVSEPGLKLKV
ncbi:MAG: MBL fold metallo-hydrolase [Pseudomonadota bacterium]